MLNLNRLVSSGFKPGLLLLALFSVKVASAGALTFQTSSIIHKFSTMIEEKVWALNPIPNEYKEIKKLYFSAKDKMDRLPLRQLVNPCSPLPFELFIEVDHQWSAEQVDVLTQIRSDLNRLVLSKGKRGDEKYNGENTATGDLRFSAEEESLIAEFREKLDEVEKACIAVTKKYFNAISDVEFKEKIRSIYIRACGHDILVDSKL